MPRQPTCLCGTCKKCKHRVRVRNAYRALSPEERRALVARRDAGRVRAYDRERFKQPEALKRLAANTKRWRNEHPDRAKAHRAVAYAIRTGKLVKEPCERCGAVKVHAHHDDYSKPLDVRWLCALHHAEEGRQL